MSATVDDYFRQRVKEEAEGGEPELWLLPELVRPGSTAIDVGANEGFFAYALWEAGAKVVAFEANPDMARLCQERLGSRITVHALAVSNMCGKASFHIPISNEGETLHLAGNLKNSHTQFDKQNVLEVSTATLDSFAFDDASFIKIDVEGSELEVLEGARHTIAQCRPALVLELLSGTFEDPLGVTTQISSQYGYRPFVVQAGKKLDALDVIRSLGSNSTWGSPFETRNVLFLPT
jgi:FkbM family methyltransferase